MRRRLGLRQALERHEVGAERRRAEPRSRARTPGSPRSPAWTARPTSPGRRGSRPPTSPSTSLAGPVPLGSRSAPGRSIQTPARTPGQPRSPAVGTTPYIDLGGVERHRRSGVRRALQRRRLAPRRRLAQRRPDPGRRRSGDRRHRRRSLRDWTEDPIMLRGNQVYVAHLGAAIRGWTTADRSTSITARRCVHRPFDRERRWRAHRRLGRAGRADLRPRRLQCPGDDDHLYVKQLIGAAWVQDGGPIAVDDADRADDPAIADIDGRPYLALRRSPPRRTAPSRSMSSGGTERRGTWLAAW